MRARALVQGGSMIKAPCKLEGSRLCIRFHFDGSCGVIFSMKISGKETIWRHLKTKIERSHNYILKPLDNWIYDAVQILLEKYDKNKGNFWLDIGLTAIC